MGYLDRKKQQQQIERANQKARRPDEALQIAAKAGGMALRPVLLAEDAEDAETLAKRVRRGDAFGPIHWDLTTDRKRTDRTR